jgi:hypothetical protein
MIGNTYFDYYVSLAPSYDDDDDDDDDDHSDPLPQVCCHFPQNSCESDGRDLFFLLHKPRRGCFGFHTYRSGMSFPPRPLVPERKGLQIRER